MVELCVRASNELATAEARKTTGGSVLLLIRFLQHAQCLVFGKVNPLVQQLSHNDIDLSGQFFEGSEFQDVVDVEGDQDLLTFAGSKFSSGVKYGASAVSTVMLGKKRLKSLARRNAPVMLGDKSSSESEPAATVGVGKNSKNGRSSRVFFV